MYAVIRRYQLNPDKTSEVLQQILEEFVPIIQELPGILGYYVLDAGDGQLATVSIFDNQAGVEVSNRIASDSLKQFLVSRVLTQDRVSSLFVEAEETLQGPFYQGVSNTPNN